MNRMGPPFTSDREGNDCSGMLDRCTKVHRVYPWSTGLPGGFERPVSGFSSRKRDICPFPVSNLVPRTGFEPARDCSHDGLSVACKPTSPPRHATGCGRPIPSLLSRKSPGDGSRPAHPASGQKDGVRGGSRIPTPLRVPAPRAGLSTDSSTRTSGATEEIGKTPMQV